MSTSDTHQQSLADAGSETRPSMLERGPYEFRIFTPSETESPRMQKEEDLRGDDLKHYEAEIEAMNLILISILNDIYNSVDACTTAKAMWQRVEHFNRENYAKTNLLIGTTRLNNEFDQFVDEPENHWCQSTIKLVNASRAKKLEKSHDPLALVAHTGSSSRTTTPYYVTNPSSMVDYDDDYQGDAVQNNFEDPLTSAMILLARDIIQCFSNPTNNSLHTSSNTRNQAIVQGDRVNMQSKNSQNDGRNIRRSYVQEEIIEGNNVQNDARNIQRTLRTTSSGTIANVQCYNCSEKGHYACNCPKLRVRDLKYFMEQMLLAKQDEAGVILTDEHNDFLFADASRMEEIEELSANICLMARIQPTNIYSDARPSYDSAFLSEVQTPSTSYVNPLFAKDNQEQKYSKQPKIINNIIGDDQIDSNIIFNEPNGDVNSGSVVYDNNVQESYALEQLAINAYKEAEKQQIIAKKESQSQFIHDRDVIQDLEQQRDKQELSVVELKRQTVELQKTQSILKCKISENEDQYHDTVLDLEVRAKKNEDVVLKIDNNMQDEIERSQRDSIEIQEGLRSISSVRRSSHKDSSFKNSVLFSTKNSLEKVEVSIGHIKTKNVLCVSCAKNVLIPCHDNCLAKYKLNVHSKVRRALFTTSRIVKSKFKDPTPIVSKTRFSVKTVQSKSLDTIPVVSKTKIAAINPLSAKHKVSSTFKL
ncbi:retrovirus-related pol polyprotein from transposon TNT 1-94 [Tanacetum coccineum]